MKKLLFFSLVLALLVTLLLPSAALAEKPVPLNWSGVILGITPGDVAPAGKLDTTAFNSKSGQWRVIERQIIGVLDSGLPGYFVLNYKGVFDLFTQEGNFHGTLSQGEYLFEVNGKTTPIDFSPMFIGLNPVQTISGNWTCLDGPWGNGTFDATIKFEIDLIAGHIIGVNPESTFTMQSR